MAMELIKKAEALSEPYEFLRAVTYNNLACYYRSARNPPPNGPPTGF